MPFSEVTVQAVTELDNKAAHCHSPVLQRHRPFPGRRLDCQPHHFFHRVVCREKNVARFGQLACQLRLI